MKSYKRLSSFAGSLMSALVAGCAATGGYNSLEYRLPEGSTVELTRTVSFPYRSARTYIQGGESLSWKNVNHYLPYCSFGLNRNRNNQPLAREIQPTRFATGDFHIGVEAAVDRIRAVQVAGLAAAAPEGNGGTPWPYTYYTRIDLYSEDAPQVDDLTCAYDGDARDRNLSLDEIRDTLGDLVRLY